MPPWVRHNFVAAAQLVRRLRDEACGQRSCEWCRRHHDPVSELNRWFGFDAIPARSPSTPTRNNRCSRPSLRRRCRTRTRWRYCQPAQENLSATSYLRLSRYNKTGALTVVISPLVALMADQVAGLADLGITSLRHGQRKPVNTRAHRGAHQGKAWRRCDPAHIPRTTPQCLGAQRPRSTRDRTMGNRRSPLPVEMGTRLPPRLPLRRALHLAKKPATAGHHRCCA